MDWIWTVGGLLLVSLGLVDLFLTVLHYDGWGFLSSHLYRVLWRTLRLITRPLPDRMRAIGLSLAPPLMVISTLILWMSLVCVGFAFVYQVGLEEGGFAGSALAGGGFSRALYLSASSLSTVGFAEATPTTPVYQVLTAVEGLIGLTIITLAIAYVISIYQLLRELGVLAAELHHKAADTSDPRSALIPHFSDGRPHGLEGHLRILHHGLVAHYEGMRHYPIVYYFHSRRGYLSTPFAFGMIGAVAGALRWGLPAGHAATKEPELPALITGYIDVTQAIERRFVHLERETPPEPLSSKTFVDVLEGREEPQDEWLERFIELDGWMRSIAGIREPPRPDEAYERYKDWLPFVHHSDAFFDAVARDLGYNPAGLSEGSSFRLLS